MVTEPPCTCYVASSASFSTGYPHKGLNVHSPQWPVPEPVGQAGRSEEEVPQVVQPHKDFLASASQSYVNIEHVALLEVHVQCIAFGVIKFELD